MVHELESVQHIQLKAWKLIFMLWNYDEKIIFLLFAEVFVKQKNVFFSWNLNFNNL